MESIQIGANALDYDDGGSGKVLLLMSGWCQDHRLFKHIVEPLRKQYRVICLEWRGHNAARTYDGDFTVDDQVNDVIAFLDAKKIDEVIPISTSHGGWANIGIAEKLGIQRVPRVIVIDWLMLSVFTELMSDLQKSQRPGTWKSGRDHLFNEWVFNTDNQDVLHHVWTEMSSFDEEMWVRSCREIEKAYRQWKSPLDRITALSPERPIAHIYSQPISIEYDRLQRDFSASHSRFTPIKIEGKTHFPTLESPLEMVRAISEFAG